MTDTVKFSDEKIRTALATVAHRLASGEVKPHTQIKRHAADPTGSIDGKFFNMQHGFISTSLVVNNLAVADWVKCGSVGCIGGWLGAELQLLHPRHLVEFAYETKGATGLSQPGLVSNELAVSLRPLFYPDSDNIDYQNVTPEQGARAIRNWLEFGDPLWADVVRGSTADMYPD